MLKLRNITVDRNRLNTKGLKFKKLNFENYLEFGFCLLNIKKVMF